MVKWSRERVAELDNTAAYAPVGGGEHARYEPHVLLRIRDDQEDRLIKLIKTCHDMGLAERMARLAEQQGTQIAAVITAVLTRLDVIDHPQAAVIVREELTRMADIESQETAAA